MRFLTLMMPYLFHALSLAVLLSAPSRARSVC